MATQRQVLAVGPQIQRNKYRIDGAIDTPAPGVDVYAAHIDSGSIRHEVVLWGVDRSLWETDDWVRSIERYERLDHHGFADVRETFDCVLGGVDATFVALNRVEGETLGNWLHARPGRDAIGSLSLLIPIAAAIDAFHVDGDISEGFAPIQPGDIVIRPDQTAVLARPPSPPARSGAAGYTAGHFVPPEHGSGDTSDSIAADAFGVGAVAAGILGAENFTPIPADLAPQIAQRTASLPEVRRGLMRAVDVDPSVRPRRLVEWLADMRGATMTPMTDVQGSALTSVAARDQSVQTIGPDVAEGRRQPMGRNLALLAAPLLLLGAFFVGRVTAPADPSVQVLGTTESAGSAGADTDGDTDSGESTVTTGGSTAGDADGEGSDQAAAAPVADPSGCDPEAYAEEAAVFIATLHRGFDWTDPDADCFLTPYEMHWIGSDPYTHDADSSGAIPDPEAQITVLINMREDGAFSTAYSLTSCDGEVHASIFDEYVESIDQKVSWRDSDGDCLHDAYELNAVGTDHLNPDSDGDGVGDAVDLEIGTGALMMSPGGQAAFIVENHRDSQIDIPNMAPTDPIVCDPDNWAEVATAYIVETGLKSTWTDTDQDCLHDEFEIEVQKTDPTNPDSDGDGELDGVDVDHTDGMIEPIDKQLVYAQANTTDR